MAGNSDQALAKYFDLSSAGVAVIETELGVGRSLSDLVLAAGLGGSGFVVEAPGSSTTNVIQPTGAAVVPLTVKGFASQSANLQQWQDSAGTPVVRLAVDGTVSFTFLSDISQTGPFVYLTSASLSVLNRTTVGNIPLVVKGMASQSGDLQQWQDSAGTKLASVEPNGFMRVPFLAPIFASELAITDGSAGPKIRINNTGIAFYNAAPVARPTGVAVSAAGIHAALVSLGLIAA